MNANFLKQLVIYLLSRRKKKGRTGACDFFQVYSSTWVILEGKVHT